MRLSATEAILIQLDLLEGALFFLCERNVSIGTTLNSFALNIFIPSLTLTIRRIMIRVYTRFSPVT